MTVSLRNSGNAPLALGQVRVARTVLTADFTRLFPPGRWSVLRAPYAFGAPAREEPDSRILVRLDQEHSSLRSFGSVAVRYSGGAGLLAGFVSGGKQICWIDMKRDRGEVEFAAVCELKGVLLAPGDTVEAETLFVAFFPDLAEGLRAFGLMAGRAAGAALKPAPKGWISYPACPPAEVNRDVVIQHARFMKEQSARLGLDLVVVGDGYQPAYGDWLAPTGRFQGGLRDLAAAVNKTGLRAGVRLAPFVVQASSSLFKRHPEWMVKDSGGAPLAFESQAAEGDSRDDWYALDCSQTDVQMWLAELFGALRRMGFKYFSLDHLYMGAVTGERAGAVTRAEAYRRGLRAVRRGAGGAYLSGSGALYPASAGLLDGVQVGERGVHQFFWAHRALWNSDPGPLSVRKLEEMPREAGSAAALSAMLAGGALVSGDFLPRLPPERLGLVADAAKLHKSQAAVPLDLFEEERPRLLAQKIGANRFRLGVFNHDAVARVVSFDLPRLGLARARVSLVEGGTSRPPEKISRRLLTPPVPPRGALLLLVEGI